MDHPRRSNLVLRKHRHRWFATIELVCLWSQITSPLHQFGPYWTIWGYPLFGPFWLQIWGHSGSVQGQDLVHSPQDIWGGCHLGVPQIWPFWGPKWTIWGVGPDPQIWCPTLFGGVSPNRLVPTSKMTHFRGHFWGSNRGHFLTRFCDHFWTKKGRERSEIGRYPGNPGNGTFLDRKWSIFGSFLVRSGEAKDG